jgi:cell division protease FtsH
LCQVFPRQLGEALYAIVKGSDSRPESLRRRAAVHEAGHILLNVINYGAAGVHATITPTSGNGGSVVMTEFPRLEGTYDDYFRHLQILLAGRTSEALVLKNVSHGAGGADGSDLERAAGAAAAMVASIGLAGPRPLLYLGSRERTDELLAFADVRQAVNEELVKAEAACRKLLEANRAALGDVADLLLRTGRIDGYQVAEILQAREISSDELRRLSPGDGDREDAPAVSTHGEASLSGSHND